jgi:hypothetical protein
LPPFFATGGLWVVPDENDLCTLDENPPESVTAGADVVTGAVDVVPDMVCCEICGVIGVNPGFGI